jgi:hypothetical protein
MATKKEETASFVLRFTQKIYNNEQGEPQIQWRGNIRHVQGGEEKRFSEPDEFVHFVQQKLADLTKQAVEDKSPEEQKGILSKSLDLWKKAAATAPKLVMESIKDPKKQVAQLQDQLQFVGESINQRIEETIGKNLEIDEWRSSSKSDFRQLMGLLEKMSEDIVSLNQKVEKLSKKAK